MLQEYRGSPKKVQQYMYKLICTFVCLVVLLFLINLNRSCLRKYAGDDMHTHWCHFHEWIDTWITHRDQQYMEWLKKMNENLRKGERAKPDIAGRDNGTARE